MHNCLFATRMCPRYLLPVVLLLGMVPLPSRAAEDGSLAAARQAWQQLNQWIGPGPNGQAWRRYLLADQLEAALARGASADPATVGRVLDRLGGGAAGLSRAPFVAARRALADWYRQLSAVTPQQLPEVVRAEKGKFQPLPPSAWQAKRREVRLRAQVLNEYLARGGEAYQAAWHRYLNWESLEAELAADNPNLAKLNTALRELYGYQPGLELPLWSELRQSLHEFMNATVVRNSPNMAEQYDQQLEQLAASIEAELANPEEGHEMAIGRALGWLSSANQAEHLQQLVRLHFAQPNLYARVSADFATGGILQAVDEVMAVRDCILGTMIVGSARTLANVRLALLPNAERAELALQFYGTAYSNNIGTQRGVTIHSTGQTRLNALKPILFDAEGLVARPARATAATDSQINSIQHRLRLVERIAWKQARRQQPAAERVASQRAAGRLQTQFDQRTTSLLVEPQQQYQELFRAPLLRRGRFPELMQLATNADGIRLRMLQAGPYQTAAPSAPPRLAGQYDITLRLHESFVGNMSEALLAGFQLTDEKLVEALEEAEREVPDELKIEPNKDPWSITFADNKPVSVEFRDQKVKIVIRGSRFTRGSPPQVVNEEMEISAVYALTRTPTGAKLTREGEVEAKYTQEGFEPAQKIAVKTLMRKKFSALFQEQFIGEGIPLEGRFGAGRTLRLADMTLEQGWLAGGWNAEAPSTAGHTAAVAGTD